MWLEGTIFTLNALGGLFGCAHCDWRDEPLLYTHLIVEQELPLGSTLGTFLLVEFGAIIDIDLVNHKTGKPDFTIPMMSGDRSHIGTEVAVRAPPGELAKYGRMMLVNYATALGSRASPAFPLDGRALLLDGRLDRVRVLSPHTLVSERGLKAIGDERVVHLNRGYALARRHMEDLIWRRMISVEEIEAGAPLQLQLARPLETINAFARHTAEAFGDAAAYVEERFPWRGVLTYHLEEEGIALGDGTDKDISDATKKMFSFNPFARQQPVDALAPYADLPAATTEVKRDCNFHSGRPATAGAEARTKMTLDHDDGGADAAAIATCRIYARGNVDTCVQQIKAAKARAE